MSDSDNESTSQIFDRISLARADDVDDMNAKSMIYLSLTATPMTLWSLFRPYYSYFSYWGQKKSLMLLLRGLVTGSPSFDLQLIRATSELVGNR
jgi:hypothetical protein